MGRGPAGIVALVVVVLIVVGWMVACQVIQRQCTGSRGRPSRKPRLLHPRTADDCAVCQTQRGTGPAPPADSSPVRPWREGRSRRGRPQRIVTEGHACPAPTCRYRGLTDAAVHALIGYGHHGTTDHIQDFLCQACGTKISARRDTALYQI
jgi:hypothetical protein